MCFVLYAASSEPFTAIPWEEEKAAFHVRPHEAPREDHPAACQFDAALTHVTYVGSRHGCGCGFFASGVPDPGEFGEDARLPTRGPEATDAAMIADHAALAAYVSRHMASGAALELFGCWSGDEDEPAAHTFRAVAPEELATCYLVEGALLRLRSPED